MSRLQDPAPEGHGSSSLKGFEEMRKPPRADTSLPALRRPVKLKEGIREFSKRFSSFLEVFVPRCYSENTTNLPLSAVKLVISAGTAEDYKNLC